MPLDEGLWKIRRDELFTSASYLIGRVACVYGFLRIGKSPEKNQKEFRYLYEGLNNFREEIGESTTNLQLQNLEYIKSLYVRFCNILEALEKAAHPITQGLVPVEAAERINVRKAALELEKLAHGYWEVFTVAIVEKF